MIYFFTPYALDKNYYKAIDFHMKLINENDWACIKDGDVMFLNSNFGHLLQEYINKYPDTGLFTCYTNRCHYKCQRYDDKLFHIPDILYHKKIANTIAFDYHLQVKELNRKIAGHLMLIKKSTWVKIRDKVEQKVIDQHKKILGVDTKISIILLKAGLKIRLMKGIYVFHFMRFDTDVNNKKHLE